jgi:hypothetical protein
MTFILLVYVCINKNVDIYVLPWPYEEDDAAV